MFVLNCDITIGKYNFKTVSGLRVNRSVHSIASTATIRLPLSARLKTNTVSNTIETNKVFNVGDNVEIKAGYDKLYTEFKGFVRKINYQKECEIECEDFAGKLRETSLKKSWQSVSLSDAISFIKTQVPGLKVTDKIPSMTINKVIIDGKSALWFLDEIKNKYGISCFFDLENTLQIGMVYQYQQGEVKYNIGYNCPDETDLQYVDANDVKLKIKAVGIKKDGTKIEKETGDSDGEERTLHFYDVSDTGTLESLAKNELEKYKFSGYRGKITGFLDPYCSPGMKAMIKDSAYGRETGNYYVESVETSISESGGRRIVELGLKLK
jgi:hypothetical protein